MTETTKYNSMLTSFSADFTLARDFIHSLSELDVLLEERNPVFMKDIELLAELDLIYDTEN